jgi:hypothetical protein
VQSYNFFAKWQIVGYPLISPSIPQLRVLLFAISKKKNNFAFTNALDDEKFWIHKSCRRHAYRKGR